MQSASSNLRLRQGGAIGLFGIITLLLAVLFVSLVVDSSRLWMQKRQLQSVADIAAIEAAKSLGCDHELADVTAAAQAAASANGFNGALASAPNIVEIGSIVTSGGIRQFQANSGHEAVRVVATRSVPASLFAGGIFSGQVVLSAQAVSIANVPMAAFSAGTSTAELNTQDSALLNSLLTQLLGSNVNLSLVSYKGIADTNITLAQLIAAKGNVANVDELLALNLTTPQFLGLLSSAIAASDTATTTALQAVQALASAAGKNTVVRLGDVLNIAAPNAEGALNVGINALSLINTTALVANGQNGITLPLAINVGGLASVNTSVKIIEPPQIAIGPPAGGSGEACTVARTSQVAIETKIASNLNLLLLALRVDLNLKVAVAQGEASLQSIDDDGSNTNVVINGSPGIASVSLTNGMGTKPAGIYAKVILLGEIPLAEISLNLPVQSPPAPMDFEVARPVESNLPQSQTTSTQVAGGLANALGEDSTLSVKPLGLPLLGVDQILGSIVRPLLVPVASAVIDPLLKLLGIQLGVLTVNLEGVQLIQPQPLVI